MCPELKSGKRTLFAGRYHTLIHTLVCLFLLLVLLQNDLTGEHTCIMLHPLSKARLSDGWLRPYWLDFQQRYMVLLGSAFRVRIQMIWGWQGQGREDAKRGTEKGQVKEACCGFCLVFLCSHCGCCCALGENQMWMDTQKQNY